MSPDEGARHRVERSALGDRYDRSTHVWVIVRVDLFQLRDGRIPEDPNVFVSVKELVDSEEQAKAEVARLNELQAGKDAVYFYERGRSLRSEKGDAGR